MDTPSGTDPRSADAVDARASSRVPSHESAPRTVAATTAATATQGRTTRPTSTRRRLTDTTPPPARGLVRRMPSRPAPSHPGTRREPCATPGCSDDGASPDRAAARIRRVSSPTSSLPDARTSGCAGALSKIASARASASGRSSGRERRACSMLSTNPSGSPGTRSVSRPRTTAGPGASPVRQNHASAPRAWTSAAAVCSPPARTSGATKPSVPRRLGGIGPDDAGDSEVGHEGPAVEVEQDVVRRQVAVHDTEAVETGQGGRHRAHHGDEPRPERGAPVSGRPSRACRPRDGRGRARPRRWAASVPCGVARGAGRADARAPRGSTRASSESTADTTLTATADPSGAVADHTVPEPPSAMGSTTS